ncbi:MAG: DUF6174 domain-containing protein [Actinomycetota bacterium]|nr:DUF6174 domain-containing protein [Actinomycetota bacterium]
MWTLWAISFATALAIVAFTKLPKGVRRVGYALIVVVLIAGAYVAFPHARSLDIAGAFGRDKVGAAKWYDSPRTDYHIALTRACFCDDAGTVSARVRGTLPTAAQVNGREIDLPTTTPLTVDDLFLIVFRAEATGAERLDVTYDDEWGYPKDIVIDGSSNTMDDELEIHVTSFEPWP